MIDLAAVRRAAIACRRDSELGTGAVPAPDVWKAVTKRRHLGVDSFGPRDPRGPDVLGTLCAVNKQIHVARRLPPAEMAFVVSHEIGHFILHPGIGLHFDRRPGGDAPTPHGTLDAVGYSARERMELEADAFAVELLCPSTWLREQVLDRGRSPSELAARIGLDPHHVLNHAVGAALARVSEAPPPAIARLPLWVDREVIAFENHHDLVAEAGPGAGATTMAATRVAKLVRDGIKPAEIIALAPSEGMLATLRDAIAGALEPGSATVWSGTPAALGFELVAKHAEELGLPSDFHLLDEVGAFSRFEDLRRRLAPGLSARAAFTTAFDAKRRLVDPRAWNLAAVSDRRSARTADDRARADRALDLGRVYAAYERRLQDEGAVDAADLAAMPVRLLQADPGILGRGGPEIRHVVLDGAQDLGPAALELLRRLASPATRIWAVGDPSRSIRRHEGARPEGMAELATAILASRRSVGASDLSPCHRSVSAWDGLPALPTVVRGRLTLHVGDHGTHAAEAVAIADRIEHHRKRGIPAHEQVVLARSHHVLRAIVAGLHASGIPTSAPPDLRSERWADDLLAVAALVSLGDPVALERVAAFPEYSIPETDVLRATAWARSRTGPLPHGCTPAGRVGLERIAADFRGLDQTCPAAKVIKTWLFERSGYLRRVAAIPDEGRRAHALACLHHVVRVAEEHEAQDDIDHRHLVLRVVRAGGMRQETAFRRAAAPPDAGEVAIMTIHAASGRPFRVVHLAGVRDGRLPVRSSGRETDDVEAHLFRVAASLATEHLHVPGTGSGNPRDRSEDPSPPATLPFAGVAPTRVPSIRCANGVTAHPSATTGA